MSRWRGSWGADIGEINGHLHDARTDFHNPLAIKNLLVDQFVEAHAHGDAVLAQLQGKAPRENHHLGLRCRVECIAGQRGPPSSAYS